MFIETLLSLSIMVSAQSAQLQMENYYLTEVIKSEVTASVPEYSSEEFRSLWLQSNLPNAEFIEEAPPVTSRKNADKHIRSLAEKRGYTLQRQTVYPQVQPFAQQAFSEMQRAARAQNIELEIVSAHRSIATQRELFLMRLSREIGRGYAYEDIAEGVYDAQIDTVLAQTAPPGYSKHHSGYALDVRDATSNKSFVDFAETRGFQWISENNYQNAKRFGFIPSYPEGLKNQGPEPEAWEYAWIGITNLLQ